MSQCERFQAQVEGTIGPVLREIGVVFKWFEPVDGCRLYYWSREREVRIFESIGAGDVNCDVLEKADVTSEYYDRWVPIRMAVRYGEGLSDAELIALMPAMPRSNEEILAEIGHMLRTYVAGDYGLR